MIEYRTIDKYQKFFNNLKGDYMTIRINNIVLGLDDDIEVVKKRVSKKLKVSINEIENFKIIKESLDARNKNNIKFTYAVEVNHKNEKKIVDRLHDNNVKIDDTMTGINWCDMPVTIIELGFMSNETDDTNMQDDAYQDKMIQGIANGIDAYFGL